MTLEYELNGAGWATATLRTQQNSVAIPVSYLNDSLRELAQAALTLHDETSKAEVVFVSEPAEHRLVFQPTGSDDITAELHRYEHWPAGDTEAPDDLLFRTQTTVSEVKRQVLRILRTIDREYGPDGYHEQWIDAEFPRAEYERLQTAL